jgi:UDP-glucose 4-epimerase
MINRELGMDIEPTFVENPIPDSVYVHDTMADASKIRSATGWEPRVDFRDGIEKVCRPYR